MKEWVGCNWGWLIFVCVVSLMLYWILNAVPSPVAHAKKSSLCPTGYVCTAVAALEPLEHKPVEWSEWHNLKTGETIPEHEKGLAQKPAQVLNPNGDMPDEWPTNSRIVFAIPSDFWKQVEQHCVAVLTDKQTKQKAQSYSLGQRGDRHSLAYTEEIAAIRCTPDKEQK